MTARILALDPGTSCGFAVSGAGAISGTWNLSPARGDSPGVRYLKLRAYLEETRRAYPDIRWLVYENAFQIGRKAIEVYDGIVTHAQSWCAEHRIEHTTVHATTLKKWATGRGNASKDEMRAAWKRKHPDNVDLLGEDEIDALWILSWAEEKLAPATNLEGIA